MKEVVENILKVEENARKKLEQAHREVEAMIVSAKKEAEELINSSRIKTKEELKEKGSRLQEEFLSGKDQILKDAKEEARAYREKREHGITKLIGDAFLKITTIVLED